MPVRIPVFDKSKIAYKSTPTCLNCGRPTEERLLLSKELQQGISKVRVKIEVPMCGQCQNARILYSIINAPMYIGFLLGALIGGYVSNTLFGLKTCPVIAIAFVAGVIVGGIVTVLLDKPMRKAFPLSFDAHNAVQLDGNGLTIRDDDWIEQVDFENSNVTHDPVETEIEKLYSTSDLPVPAVITIRHALLGTLGGAVIVIVSMLIAALIWPPNGDVWTMSEYLTEALPFLAVVGAIIGALTGHWFARLAGSHGEAKAKWGAVIGGAAGPIALVLAGAIALLFVM